MLEAEYDEEAEALYVYLSDAPIARTIELKRPVLIDVDADGNVVGVEVLGVRDTDAGV